MSEELIDSLNLPVDQRWLMRQMNLVDRHIERKTRLLPDMPREDLEREKARENKAVSARRRAPGRGEWTEKVDKKRIV
ncbi:MAG: hypothetical protein ACRD3T_19890 [Terriglobia bacterium]